MEEKIPLGVRNLCKGIIAGEYFKIKSTNSETFMYLRENDPIPPGTVIKADKEYDCKTTKDDTI